MSTRATELHDGRAESALRALPGGFGFATALDAVDDLVLIKGDRSRLLWANRAFLAYYGMSNDELQDIVDAPHSDPDDTVQYVRDDHQVFTTGVSLTAIEPITRSDGEVAYFSTTKSAIRSVSGQVVGTIGVSRPVTEVDVEKHSEARADRKQLLGYLRSMVNHVPVALAMLDTKQRFIAHSADWVELFGVESDSLVGEFYESAHERSLPLVRIINTAIADCDRVSLETLELTPATGNREIALCDVAVQPWYLPTREVGGVIVLISDRTVFHESKQLQQELTEEITQFNYRVSHDLVAPLRTMSGLSTVMRAQIPSESGQRPLATLDRIDNNVGRMTELVHSLLNLARVEAETGIEIVDLDEIINGILESKSSEISDRGVQIERRLTWSWLRCERARVEQIAENLISNALKFIDTSEPKNRIILETHRDGDDAIFCVEDNGLGFDAAVSTKIFERFGRGQSALPGSGLGLFLVRRHLDRMNGSVQATNARKNTRFEVRLPAGTLENQP